MIIWSWEPWETIEFDWQQYLIIEKRETCIRIITCDLINNLRDESIDLTASS